jgi:hypothetical protein
VSQEFWLFEVTCVPGVVCCCAAVYVRICTPAAASVMRKPAPFAVTSNCFVSWRTPAPWPWIV